MTIWDCDGQGGLIWCGLMQHGAYTEAYAISFLVLYG